MDVISIATLKGGSAKTTTAVNLAAVLARKGKKILLIDSDPQANLTWSLGVTEETSVNLYTEYKKEITGQKSDLAGSIVAINDHLHLIPSSIELANAELELVSKFAREQTLRNRMLPPLRNQYDYIFIDCPPSFTMLTVNALVASDGVLIPVQGEFLPRKGVESFLHLVEEMKEMLAVRIQLVGFVLTRFSDRKSMNREVQEWLRKEYGDKLFETIIRTDIRLAVAQKKGKDIFSFAPHSNGAADYEKLGEEFLARCMAMEKERQNEKQLPLLNTS
jgi:chromosome partitioning protein